MGVKITIAYALDNEDGAVSDSTTRAIGLNTQSGMRQSGRYG